MKNFSPIYTVLATMAVAAMAIGGEPVRHNSKSLELSKVEATKAGYELLIETAVGQNLRPAILVLDARQVEAAISANVAVAIAGARARRRTG